MDLVHNLSGVVFFVILSVLCVPLFSGAQWTQRLHKVHKEFTVLYKLTAINYNKIQDRRLKINRMHFKFSIGKLQGRCREFKGA
jgi:hypothetical protein